MPGSDGEGTGLHFGDERGPSRHREDQGRTLGVLAVKDFSGAVPSPDRVRPLTSVVVGRPEHRRRRPVQGRKEMGSPRCAAGCDAGPRMSTQPAQPVTAELARRLSALTLRDEQRLGRRLDGARRVRKPDARDAVLAEITADIDKAELRVAARRATVPAVTYPEQLPVSQKRDDILAAVRDHQVVIVAGETGSGKTTQIPKICLELGRGVRGLIGHTQPRRIAARTVAERVAEELGTELGALVGYTVRFTDRSDENTLVRLMTDGILLAQIQRDRRLLGYDTLIIDEAHERSLNIDFLLGYLHQLLPQRPDLKLIITSATIDPDRFARHFAHGGTPAPVIEVSGRTYPVEIRYRPLVPDVA